MPEGSGQVTMTTKSCRHVVPRLEQHMYVTTRQTGTRLDTVKSMAYLEAAGLEENYARAPAYHSVGLNSNHTGVQCAFLLLTLGCTSVSKLRPIPEKPTMHHYPSCKNFK